MQSKRRDGGAGRGGVGRTKDIKVETTRRFPKGEAHKTEASS